MKAFKFFSLFVAAVFSVAAVKAQTADEIVNKHIDAIGGAANWKKVTSIVLTGTMNVNGTDVSVVNSVLHNKGSRQDISVMGMNGFQILTPTAGWNFMPFQGQTAPEPMREEDVKENQDDLDVQGSLIDYKAKGHAIELIGSEDVEGTDCFKLKLGLKSGRAQTYFIDKKTYNVIRSISVKKANGQEMEVTTTFSNFQKLPEGIIMPMTMNLPIGPGVNVDFALSKVEVNKAIDESIFKPAK